MRQRLLHSSADRLKEKYKSCKSNGRYIPDEMQMKTLEKPAFELFEGFFHIVFTPKYRRKIVYNQYKSDLRDILKQLCSYKGVEILEGHLMPDHVHMLVSIPPKISVSSFMGYLKGKSALMMFDRHANLKYKFGNRHFWSEGYYVSTVGLNEATIKKYIQEQEKADIMQDKLSVKEYEDPFKGQG